MSGPPQDERPPTVKALMDMMEAMAKVLNEWAEQLRPAFEQMAKVRIPNPLTGQRAERNGERDQ